MPYYKAFIKTPEGVLRSKYSDFVYESGKAYKHNGDIEICKSGFHCCRHPKDCYKYYPKTDNNIVIYQVDPIGKLLWRGEDKLCTDIIKIGRELSNEEIKKCNTRHWR